MSVDFNKLFVHQVNAFDIKQNYDTTIRITSDGLSVFVFHQEILDYAASYQWPNGKDAVYFVDVLKSIVAQDSFLNNLKSNIAILLDDKGYALVPKTLFDESLLTEYLACFVDKDSMSEGVPIFAEENQKIVISLMDAQLMDSVKNVFTNASVYSYSLAFLKLKSDSSNLVYNASIAINNGYFDLKIEKRGQLIFFNRFAFSSKEDFIYFLIMTMQQLEIENDEVSISILGIIESQSPLNEMLSRYFKAVHFVKSIFPSSWDYHRYCVEQNYIL